MKFYDRSVECLNSCFVGKLESVLLRCEGAVYSISWPTLFNVIISVERTVTMPTLQKTFVSKLIMTDSYQQLNIHV